MPKKFGLPLLFYFLKKKTQTSHRPIAYFRGENMVDNNHSHPLSEPNRYPHTNAVSKN